MRNEPGFRDYTADEREVIERLRSEYRMAPDADDWLERCIECIENLVAFRDSFREKCKATDTKMVLLGQEIDSLNHKIASLTASLEAKDRQIRVLRQRIADGAYTLSRRA